MIGPDYVLWVVLLLVALLAGAVLYLLITSRHYQRVDYSFLLDQEERQRRLQSRIRQLEQMIGDLAAYDRRRRRELDHAVKDAKRELGRMIHAARNDIVDEVLNEPRRVDNLLLRESGAELRRPDPAGRERPGSKRDENRNMLNFLKSPRQQRIAEQLELGYSSQDVSRMLGVSRHEVELVASIIFSDHKSA